jgi:CheY-like chemotaxis protein
MRTVLIADDSAVARRVLTKRLAAEGFVVREESAAAVAREADPSQLLCAILDIDFADGDGAEVARMLRERHASLPVAFFTGGADAVQVDRARALGPVFTKPDEIERIISWVRGLAEP